MLTTTENRDRVPGLRTLQTHLARQGLNVRADGRAPGKVYGRFEAAARNELWTGDGLHGAKLADSAARAVLVAFSGRCGISSWSRSMTASSSRS